MKYLPSVAVGLLSSIAVLTLLLNGLVRYGGLSVERAEEIWMRSGGTVVALAIIASAGALAHCYFSGQWNEFDPAKK